MVTFTIFDDAGTVVSRSIVTFPLDVDEWSSDGDGTVIEDGGDVSRFSATDPLENICRAEITLSSSMVTLRFLVLVDEAELMISLALPLLATSL